MKLLCQAAVAFCMTSFVPAESFAQLGFDDESGRALVWGIADGGERRWSLWCGDDYDGPRCTEQVWEFAERHDRCDILTKGLMPEQESVR